MRRVVLLVGLFGLFLIGGCGGGDTGPKREAVTGSVTREGIPVDRGTILFKPAGGGPAASIAITDGKYQFTKENGPVAGKQAIEIIQFPRREEVPPGTPKKDAAIIPETRFKKKMPDKGWTREAEVTTGQTAPIDFHIDE